MAKAAAASATGYTAVPAPRFLQPLFLPALYTSQRATTPPSSRLFSSTPQALRAYKPKKGKSKLETKSRFPRDRDIVHKLVVVRGEDGRLSEPQRTSDVLASLDLRVNSLVVIALPETELERSKRKAKEQENEEGEEEEEEEGGEGEEGGAKSSGKSSRPEYPICRVVDKMAEHEAAVEKAKVERKKSVGSKEVEVNWAIAPNDMQTKLRQLKKFLSKGMRVQILMLSRPQKKKKKATEDQAREVLRAVKEAIDEVPGSKEYKGMEGAVGGQMRIFVEGPQGGVRVETTPSEGAKAETSTA